MVPASIPANGTSRSTLDGMLFRRCCARVGSRASRCRPRRPPGCWVRAALALTIDLSGDPEVPLRSAKSRPYSLQVTWVFWLNVIAGPVVLGSIVAAITTWSVRRSLSPRLEAVEQALLRLQQHEDTEFNPKAIDAAPRSPDLLELDPHDRYRRPK